MKSYNWRCPFCDRDTTITDHSRSFSDHRLTIENRHGKQVIKTMAIACPNNECRELFVQATMGAYEIGPSIPGRNPYQDAKPHVTWVLRPEASVRPFPNYVPAPILDDYREACLIRALSPKASATLARRCLQGMIRDFWGIKKNRLVDEIKALEEKLDPKTWGAVDAVRTIGNIGAHMEKDINLIVDVDPNEATLLIELIEGLIEEWYIERYERTRRMDRIVAAAAAKKNSPAVPDASPTQFPSASELTIDAEEEETPNHTS